MSPKIYPEEPIFLGQFRVNPAISGKFESSKYSHIICRWKGNLGSNIGSKNQYFGIYYPIYGVWGSFRAPHWSNFLIFQKIS